MEMCTKDQPKEYIDREAVLTVLKAIFDETNPVGEEQFGVLKAHRIVREAPAADVVEVVHGEWIEKIGRAKCSICADECWADSAMEYSYCPNCGAKMDGGSGNIDA